MIYAGSLVNPALLEETKEGCRIYNSATMTLDEVIAVIREAEAAGQTTVRLHTGDPSIYGAIRGLEYTLPTVSQSVIITRMEGRTKVPARESIESFAAHQATMVLFLSSGMIPELVSRLTAGGYPADTPAAIVYRATWPDEKRIVTTLENLAEKAAEEGITKTALIIVGRAVAQSGYELSKLYDPGFSTEYRPAKQ